MRTHRDLMAVNAVILLVLAVALWLVGWQAALFGLSLLLVLDLWVLLRGRPYGSDDGEDR